MLQRATLALQPQTLSTRCILISLIKVFNSYLFSTSPINFAYFDSNHFVSSLCGQIIYHQGLVTLKFNEYAFFHDLNACFFADTHSVGK